MNNISESYIDSVCLHSETFPKIPDKLISRKSYYDLIEEQFEDYKILCFPGCEGVGLTTALAEFAKEHCKFCITYFIDGFSRLAMEPRIIENSLAMQMNYLINPSYKEKVDEKVDLNDSIIRIKRRFKSSRKPLYFVLDGFDKIPITLNDSIKHIINNLLSIDNVKFLFSGKEHDIKNLLPETENAKETNNLMKFHEDEVTAYLMSINSSITEEQSKLLFAISRGNAEKLSILINKLENGVSISDIENIYMYDESDLYASDWDEYINYKNKSIFTFLGLIGYSEMKLNPFMIQQMLNINKDELNYLLNICKKDLDVEKNYIVFKEASFRKYVRRQLSDIKRDIELIQISTFEKYPDTSQFFPYMPSLYKQLGRNKSMVTYLTSDNVQQFLIEKKSQAAFNEQCEYGFEACKDLNEMLAEYFRFAINRSSSREIEKNELYDSEIEALLALNEDEAAYTLCQNIYLNEEKLKSFLIIARKGDRLPTRLKEQLLSNIAILSDSIDYEHIPQKAIEIAKLMLPVDFVKALSIIDRIAKSSKDKNQYDRLYTAISLSYDELNKGKDDVAKMDLAATKIKDESVRKMAIAMRAVLHDSSVKQIISELDKIPKIESRLYFLQFWIPDHCDVLDIEKIVLYAVKLVIESSNTTLPKASLLCKFCEPLYKVSNKALYEIIDILEAVDDSIKYPSSDYVDLQLIIIEAQWKVNVENAQYRLMKLYEDILKIEDKSLVIFCKAKILAKSVKLVTKKSRVEFEDCLKTGFALQQEITEEIKELLTTTAYHIKIVEGPIRELVCGFRSFVKDVISLINTNERKSRAYVIAATEYVDKVDIDDYDFSYFKYLYDNIVYDRSERTEPLVNLVIKIVTSNEEKTRLSTELKKLYPFIKEIENELAKCYILSTLYVWYKNNFSNDSILIKIKNDIKVTWNKIGMPWLKVSVGFEIAKEFSKLSNKQEAYEIIRSTSNLKNEQLFYSASCLEAFTVSLDLLAESLGILIRSNLCEERDIEQFKNLMSYIDSTGECMILWSKIALEYYIANDNEKFLSIVNKYVAKPIKDYSTSYQKRILYNISPALYLSGKPLFYSTLENFDDDFRNHCLDIVGRFIFNKVSNLEYTESSQISASLRYNEYENLLDLIEHSTDECLIFNYTTTICNCLQENKDKKLSGEIINLLFKKLESIIKSKLPLEGGIKHNGYKIACLAAIYGSQTNNNMKYEEFKNDIEQIPNIADQSFLYSQVSHYFKKVAIKQDFLKLGFEKAKNLSTSYDKLNRFDMCLSEAIDKSSELVRHFTLEAWNWILTDKNNNYQGAQKFIDLVNEYDEELTQYILDQLDTDPARIKYKNKFKQHLNRKKKIEAAKKDIKMVTTLNNEEQQLFFEEHMENLVKGKSITKNLKSTIPILQIIYENSISDTKHAISYFIENLYEKNKKSNSHKELIRDIYSSVLYNLKVVLSLAAGTKERFERIDNILKKDIEYSNDKHIGIGEEEKAFNFLINWFKENKNDSLRIMDPFFKPSDFYIIKEFFDINNDLRVEILTNIGDNINIDEFQKGWNRISSELTGEIIVNSFCYEEEIKKCPIHDRWWVLVDSENNNQVGLSLNSISGLGKRESGLNNLDEEGIKTANKIWTDYIVNKRQRVEGKKIMYKRYEIK